MPQIIMPKNQNLWSRTSVDHPRLKFLKDGHEYFTYQILPDGKIHNPSFGEVYEFPSCKHSVVYFKKITKRI